MSRHGSRTALLGALAVTALLVSGCGDATSDTASDTTSTPPTGSAPPTSSAPPTTPTTPVPTTPTVDTTPPVPLPRCATVWVEGKKLPEAFRGCLDAGGPAKLYKFPCEFGRSLIAYADHYYAVPGGTIHHTTATLAKDADYQHALRSCGG